MKNKRIKSLIGLCAITSLLTACGPVEDNEPSEEYIEDFNPEDEVMMDLYGPAVYNDKDNNTLEESEELEESEDIQEQIELIGVGFTVDYGAIELSPIDKLKNKIEEIFD